MPRKTSSRWCGTCKMLRRLADQIVEEFQKLSPAEQERFRKEFYEEVTGKPYRPTLPEF